MPRLCFLIASSSHAFVSRLRLTQGHEEALLLLCDSCNSAYHTFCVGLGRVVPAGDWYCVKCAAARDVHGNASAAAGMQPTDPAGQAATTAGLPSEPLVV